MKSLFALLASILLSMRSLPVSQESTQLPALDLVGFWNMLVQVFEQTSAFSGSVRDTWLWLMNQLPASTVLWFTLGVFSTAGYGFFKLGMGVCKVLMVMFWIIFTIMFVKAELHL